MAWMSPNRHGYLRICFRWQGVECKEGTKLKDTPANRQRLQPTLDQLQYEIDHGVFDYRRHFPHGTKVARFGEATGRGARPWCRSRSTPCSGCRRTPTP